MLQTGVVDVGDVWTDGYKDSTLGTIKVQVLQPIVGQIESTQEVQVLIGLSFEDLRAYGQTTNQFELIRPQMWDEDEITAQMDDPQTTADGVRGTLATDVTGMNDSGKSNGLSISVGRADDPQPMLGVTYGNEVTDIIPYASAMGLSNWEVSDTATGGSYVRVEYQFYCSEIGRRGATQPGMSPPRCPLEFFLMFYCFRRGPVNMTFQTNAPTDSTSSASRPLLAYSVLQVNGDVVDHMVREEYSNVAGTAVANSNIASYYNPMMSAMGTITIPPYYNEIYTFNRAASKPANMPILQKNVGVRIGMRWSDSITVDRHYNIWIMLGLGEGASLTGLRPLSVRPATSVYNAFRTATQTSRVAIN